MYADQQKPCLLKQQDFNLNAISDLPLPNYNPKCGMLEQLDSCLFIKCSD